MSTPDKNIAQGATPKVVGRSARHRVAKWIGIALGILVGLPLLLLVALTLWLTPQRLTSLVNKEGSRYLNADIRAEDVDYTLWSTFPRFKITTGEIRIISRTLDSISPSILRQLPDSAKFLGGLKSFTGEINVVDLFMNRYVIHDVSVDGLHLNLVAYNDSINNYNIIPTGGSGLKKVPYISAEKIQLKNPGTLAYTSVASATSASVNLDSLNLMRKHGRGVEKNTYDLQIKGIVTATSAGLEILKDFPFSLGGDLRLRFDPFGVALSDYSIDLGELKSQLTMSLGVGDDPRLETFEYKISDVSLTGLLGYIPKEFVPSLQGLEADVQVSASARLLSAWSLSSDTFPSVEVDFRIPEGDVSYTMAMSPTTSGSSAGSSTRYATYTLRHGPIDALFVFDGENPDESYMQVKEFDITTDGVEVGVGVKVTGLTSRPLVATTLDVQADVARTLRLLPFTPPVTAGGAVAMHSDISFSVASLSKEAFAQGLENVVINADVKADNLHLNAPSLGLQGSVDNLNLTLSETTDQFNSAGLYNPKVNITGTVASTSLSLPGGGSAKVGGLSFATQTGYSGMLTPQMVTAGLPIAIKGELQNVRYSDPASRTFVSAPKLLFSDRLSKRTGDPALDLLSDGIALQSPAIDLSSGKNSLRIHNLDLTARLSMRDTTAGSSANVAAADIKAVADSRAATGLPHTPELISFEAPAGLRQFMESYALHARLKTGMIDILTPGLRHDNYLANIDLSVNEDDVRLDNVDVMIKRTRGNIKANLGNLRSFLLNPASEDNPLIADLTVDVDTVNINALARAYVESKGGMEHIPRHDTVTASDSVALIVPKNLRVRVDLSADEILYTNLDLDRLRAKIDMHDGMVDIPNLGLVTSFGGADLNVRYDSRSLDDLSLNLGLNLNELNIVRMLKKFPSFTRMMPELKNVSGSISAGVTCSTDIFPDMYINMPSVVADAEVEGRKLIVKQSPFIRKITRMMLIESGDPIHIRDMNIHASIHDNLLQLDPFYFQFDRYKLRMVGVNNFNGDLYYHIGVEKSPVPFPFSVNIEGEFHHPKLRFGGGRYDTAHAERITSQIQEENNMNMVLILRKLLRAFIGEAAKKNW